ncbi:hypothetical protein [Streptomyces abikoensis]|uniref:Uncharacterized protein n=1 Tax=Streptomyces abikoensis TaxID=97398 RepID=A0ABW7SZX7_9ACTN
MDNQRSVDAQVAELNGPGRERRRALSIVGGQATVHGASTG